MGTCAQVCHLPKAWESCLPGHRESPGDAVGWEKPAMAEGSELLCPMTLAVVRNTASITVLPLQPHHPPPAIPCAQDTKPG